MRRRFLNKKSNSIHISYESQYFTIEALEDGLTAKLSTNACEYRIDNGSWNTLSAGSNTTSINKGQTLSFKCNLTPTSSSGVGTFTISKKCNLKGNIMSLLYGDDVEGQTDLTGKGYAFHKLFQNCTNIVDASELVLPATTLANYCYYMMFNGCASLTSAPELPATTLTYYCYNYMFNGCASLTSAPELPATTLAESCYCNMFYGCTSLVNAPELPATTLSRYCYQSMFNGCTSLTNAPELPATTLYECCYQSMFRGCTSLTIAPALPATTLADYCYVAMFSGCVGLTTAPELLATTLAEGCYSSMFSGCSKLNYVKMLATDISASSCLSNWVQSVSSTGTFVKHLNMTTLPSGVSGIPEGWVVKNHITLTECTSLTITADAVIGNETTTTIHYTAICNGIYYGDTVTGIVYEGTAVSAEFP
jgi:hypothetical protein